MAAKKSAKRYVELVGWSAHASALLLVCGPEALLVDPLSGGERIRWQAPAEIDNWAMSTRHLVVHTQDGQLLAFDLQSRRATFAVPEPRFVASMEISPDGATLVTVAHDVGDDFGTRFVGARDMATGEARGPSAEVDGTPFVSPAADFVALTTIHGATIVNTAGENVVTLVGVGSAPHIIAWSRGSGRIAGGNVDGMVQVWEAKTGRMLASFEDDDGAVRALDISADGETIVYCTDEAPVRLVSMKTKKSLAQCPPKDAECLALAPAGALVAILRRGSVELRELPKLGLARKT
jgi:WD40 repeat protein